MPEYDPIVEKLIEDHKREIAEKILEEAIDKWLDKKFASFGKWSAWGIASLAFAALIYLYVHTGGFSK